MSATQNRVAVITTSHEVLIWSIGGPLKALNWSKTKQSWQGHVVVPVAVIFNPDDTSKYKAKTKTATGVVLKDILSLGFENILFNKRVPFVTKKK